MESLNLLCVDMNAKEFAHELEKAASFIRQQQAEIEALKQIIDANNLNQNIGQFVKPTNEPVAWISRLPEGDVYNCAWAEKQNDDDIPLYTHPVSKAKDRFPNYESICLQCGTTIYKPFKELTDEDRSMLIRTLKWAEDLLRVAGHEEAVSDVQDCLMIIRKAQEK